MLGRADGQHVEVLVIRGADGFVDGRHAGEDVHEAQVGFEVEEAVDPRPAEASMSSVLMSARARLGEVGDKGGAGLGRRRDDQSERCPASCMR